MDNLTKAIVDALLCVGSDKRGTIYVTVPITTGLREFQLMRELKCDRQVLRERHRDRWIAEVKVPNEADAEAYSLMVQLQNPDKLVLNPAALQVDGWSQQQYSSMWDLVLAQFCHKLVVTPDWAFSVGARHEVQQMLNYGREVTDMFGNRLTSDSIDEADKFATEQLFEMGWTKDEVSSVLPQLKFPPFPIVGSEPKSDRGDFDDAVKWVIEERAWQNRDPIFKDRERTERDGPKAEKGLWDAKLRKYFEMAREHGPKSEEGRTHILTYVSLAVAMMEQVSSVFGPFPEPGFGRGEKLRVSRLHAPEVNPSQRHAVIMAWLLREYYYVREKYPKEEDDRATLDGIGDNSWWVRQLDSYWIWAHSYGLDNPKGRQALGKFTSTAMGLAASCIRLYGVPPHPRRLTADELRAKGLFDIDD